MKIKRTLSLISKIKQEMDFYITSELEKKGISGIVPSHGDILVALYMADQPLTMVEISNKIRKTQPTVTVLIKKLESLGYVTRERNATDGRSLNVILTKKGLEFKDVFFDISEKVSDKISMSLSDIESEMLDKILLKVFQSLDND